jgi:hypothetical protein
MTMKQPLIIVCSLFAAMFAPGSDRPAVRTDSADLVSPRTLDKETQTAVIRDYLEAWGSFRDAFEQNQSALLDRGFTGTAREKLADTIREQTRIGIRTRYQDSAHDLHLVFYSPEGLSIQLIDTVEYNVQIVDGQKVLPTQHVRARYVAVLTPTEVRWKVRVFQAEPE